MAGGDVVSAPTRPRAALPTGCGAAQYDGGPYCNATPTRPFACGPRCSTHAPVNRKTGLPVPFLPAVKEPA